MAIYQFSLAIIPKTRFPDTHFSDPIKLNPEEAKTYFNTLKSECWKNAHVKADQLLPEIDRMVDRGNWKMNSIIGWKTYTDFADNDASLSFEPGTGNVEGLSFRADLREPGLKFLVGMLELALENGFLVMDKNGTIANPEMEEVLQLIRNSNAYRFLKDPAKFLNDLESNNENGAQL